MDVSLDALASHPSRVQVAVRIRPLNNKESSQERVIVRVLDNKTLVLIDPFDEEDVLRQKRQRERMFAFDCVFDETASQTDVYEATAKLLIDDVLNGMNTTAFAYGATSSGKTFTMFGTDAQPGIVEQTLTDLYRALDSISSSQSINSTSDTSTVVSLSYIEIYNENIRDLLANKSKFLELREDPHRGTVVAGLKQVETRSLEEMMQFVRRGHKCRITEYTTANAVSSRSHAIVQVTVSRTVADGKRKKKKKVLVGKLSLIDLAGSERAAAAQNSGVRMVEGSMINRSLLALGNCINALSSRIAPSYVNYRDSKLTRILKASLRDNCRTLMIANLCPTVTAFDETWNTLKYASRAKNVLIQQTIDVVASKPGSPNEKELDGVLVSRIKLHTLNLSVLQLPLFYGGLIRDEILTYNQTHKRGGYQRVNLNHSKSREPNSVHVNVKTKVAPLPKNILSWRRIEGVLKAHLLLKQQVLGIVNTIGECTLIIEQGQMEIESWQRKLSQEIEEVVQRKIRDTLQTLEAKTQETIAKQQKNNLQKIVLQGKLDLLSYHIAQLEKQHTQRVIFKKTANSTGTVDNDVNDGTVTRTETDFMDHLFNEHHLALDRLETEVTTVQNAELMRQKDVDMCSMQQRLKLYEQLIQLQTELIDVETTDMRQLKNTIEQIRTKKSRLPEITNERVSKHSTPALSLARPSPQIMSPSTANPKDSALPIHPDYSVLPPLADMSKQ